MKLRELFTAEAVSLDLAADAKDDILKELVGLLRLDEKSEGILYKTLKRRENLGSTGIRSVFKKFPPFLSYRFFDSRSFS